VTQSTSRVFYQWTRDLHLYCGLFVSPFLLLFAVSVFYLNHAKLVLGTPPTETFHNLGIPDDVDRLQGRPAVDRAREILVQLPLTGEIGFLRNIRASRHLVFPVSRPGLDAMVDVDLNNRSAVVTRRRTGLLESVAFLHKMPGPHNVAIRGNWKWIQAWRPFADATIYLTLFISATGIYLWWTLKTERKAGLALLTAGAVTFFGLIYVVIR
jgi:hypothetical protein